MSKNGDTVTTYLNGTQIDKYNFGQNSSALNLCKIGASNYSNASTIGCFQEFRIWKTARTAQEIQQNFLFKILNNSSNLYYYLPLNLSNTVQNVPIKNNTILNNSSTAIDALNSPSTIISQGNIGCSI